MLPSVASKVLDLFIYERTFRLILCFETFVHFLNRFLRGECLKLNCLLSHNVSLSKMPVCKFFLQGVCVRNDCPYLHKKLSNKAELCTDFQRGFCQLADKVCLAFNNTFCLI